MKLENSLLLAVEGAVNRVERHLDRLEQRLAKLETTTGNRLARLEEQYTFPTEKPPPETWRDVTAECEMAADGTLYHQQHKNVKAFLYLPPILPGYRLRKVILLRPKQVAGSLNFSEQLQAVSGQTPMESVHAFLVEQCEP